MNIIKWMCKIDSWSTEILDEEYLIIDILTGEEIIVYNYKYKRKCISYYNFILSLTYAKNIEYIKMIIKNKSFGI